MARINLLPWREERRKARQVQFNILAGMVAAAGAFAVTLMYLWMSSAISAQNDRNKYLQDQITFMDHQIDQIKDLQDTKSNLLARMQIIQQLQSSRPIMVHLFDQLVRTLPPGVYLTSVAESGDSLTLEGTAESSARISTYLRNIDASPFMGDPNLMVVAKDPVKSGAQHFTISAKVMDKAAAAASSAAPAAAKPKKGGA
ncbi:MAG TPA: PilN domain-containing protein [Gammaproteobacteria bacterium]|jgi:type IV pilus assembly protein PilN